MAIDKLLGTEKPHGQTPLELATMADMAMEIGSREHGQPAILIYSHGDGRWPVRMGPGVSSDTLRKMAKILVSVAEQHRAMQAGECDDDRTIRTPWGTLRGVSDWSGKRDSLLNERQFEVLTGSAEDSLAGDWRWLPCILGFVSGLIAAAAANFVFALLG